MANLVLPTKPSLLISIALDTMREYEGNMRFQITSDVTFMRNTKISAICMNIVGATILQKFGTGHLEDDQHYTPFEYGQACVAKGVPLKDRDGWGLIALSCLAAGNVGPAMHTLKMDPKDTRQLRRLKRFITPYDESPKMFVKDMQRLSRDFASKGW